MAYTWSPVELLTSTDPFNDGNDCGSLPSVDLCWIGNGLVVVKAFSYDSYGIRLWAIDVSGSEPVVGPVLVVNGTAADFSWMANPHPGDPKGQAMYECAFVVALPGFRFAISGGASNNYDVAGDIGSFGDPNIHVASFFEVNPTTLEVARIAFVLQDYSALPGPSWDPTGGAWLDDVTMCRYGDEDVVIVSNDYNYVLIARPDGTTTVWPFVVEYAPGSYFDLLGVPVVVGDECILTASDFSDDYTAFKVNLVDGTITQGDTINGSNDYQTAWFACATETGGAYLMTANNAVNRCDRTIAFLEADLSNDGVHPVVSDTAAFGWTSDWNGPVASVTWTGNSYIVSYVDYFLRTMWMLEVNDALEPGVPQSIPFPNADGYFVQCARAVVVPGFGVSAVYVRQTNGSEDDYTYGVNFIMTTGVEEPGAVDSTNQATARFWG